MSPATEPAEELLALAGAVLAQESLPDTLAEVCRIAVRAVSAADGVSITTLSNGSPHAIADDEWAKGFDELQYAEQEGPCLDAYRTGNAFRIRDLACEPRWPSWVSRAVERGARSMMSLPMSAHGQSIGALNLYARGVDSFRAEDAAIGSIIAAHAGMASQVAAAFFGHRQLAENLAEAMRSRATIEQAKGIVMANRGCDADSAYAVLVDVSQRSNQKLRDIAAKLVKNPGPASP